MSEPVPRSPSISPDGPLSAADVSALVAARRGAKKLRRAATVAALSGWSMACFAGLTLLGLLFGDVSVIAPAVVLSLLAYNELRGASMLRRFDARGPGVLGRNQLTLALVIIGYAAWSLATAQPSSALASVGGSTGDAGLDASIKGIETMVFWALNLGVAALGAIVPPLTAWYYYSRARLIREFLDETPSWITDTLAVAA